MHYYVMVDLIQITPKLLVPLSIIYCSAYLVRLELFIFWMQLSYQSVIVEQKKETKFLERLHKKAKLQWVAFLLQVTYHYQRCRSNNSY